MSMTREEASVQIEGLKKYCEDMADSDENGSYVFDLDVQALDLALSALRPVSRERVEKVWPGCHKCRTCDSCAYRTIKPEEEPCVSCNTDIYSNYKPEPGRIFCSTCGAPVTDEAVDMVMERMEALHGKTD